MYDSCVYNEIQYLLPAIQCNNKKLNIWPQQRSITLSDDACQ